MSLTGCSHAADKKVVQRYKDLGLACVRQGRTAADCDDIYVEKCQNDAHWHGDEDAATTECEGARLPTDQPS